MAKKKATSKRMGRPPVPGGPRGYALGIRARDEWKQWLAEFAEFCRGDMVEVVDDALENYAKLKGFRLPPKR